jgi:hypothetical protein
VERVGVQRPLHVARVAGRDAPVDLAQVPVRPLEHRRGHVEALRLRLSESVGDVDRHVGPRLVAAAPEGEAAVVVLHGAQPLEVAFNRGLQLLGLRQPLGAERREHVAQSGDGEDA